MKIKDIPALRHYIAVNSAFSPATIDNVIVALGYCLNGSWNSLKELSTQFENCAEHGADCGFSGFIYYDETITFFQENRADIVNHLETTAAELDTDIISLVQNFGVFRCSQQPTVDEVGKALWDNSKCNDDLTNLYNVFSWYTLEEVSRVWYRYLVQNPAYRLELAA